MPERDLLAPIERYAPYVLLLLVVVFMLWVRLIPTDRVITDTAVYFSGNDPWYHNRMVHYTVRHFPETTPFDPWSYFPYGTGRHSGFGGLFDQLIALAALVLGLGSPSERLTDTVTALAPPVFGALTAVPTYVIAKRITDRWWGLVAAGLLALSSGGILARTMVGTADHQSAESLFAAIAVVGFAFAIAAAYRESPMLEDVQDRNWSYLRPSVLAGIAGGIAIASYLALWPPGVLLLFTFGVFVVIQIVREHLAGRATDHLAIATVVTMATAGVLTLLYAREYTLSSTAFSLLQPLVAFGVAVGAVALFWLSRYAEREGYDRQYYPPVVGGLILVTLAMTWLVYPEGINMLRQLFVRVYSFGLLTTRTAGTVAEVQPATPDAAFDAFGLMLLLAGVGFLLLVYHVYRENRPLELLVILWSLTMFAAYFTMARFGYYFAVNVAILSAFGVWWISTRWLGVDFDVERIQEIELYQVIGILVIIMLVVPGNVVAMSGRQPVWDQAENPALSGTNQAWYDGMTWMDANTPEVPMEYYEQYEQPPDGDYDYPEGAYGVMSWWDYGHWITVMGHRIPYANPFQQNPPPASAYLQAANETRANLILEALPSFSENPGGVSALSTSELRDVIAGQDEQEASENGRYVVIDDQMAGGKFPAITQWAGPETDAYFQNGQYQFQGQNVTLPETTQRYDQTMLAKLYYRDATGLEHYRLVHEVDRYSIVGGYIQGQGVRTLTSLTPPGFDWERAGPVAAQLQQSNRAGQVVSLGQGTGQYVYNAHVESRVKVYERVEGATLTGTVPGVQNRTPVVAYVQLQTQTGRDFTYITQTQTGPDGSFEMTVPYATDDDVSVGEGGTNSSVRANGEYTIQAGTFVAQVASGTAEVPESAVYEGREVPVTLEPAQQGNESTTSGNETTGSLSNEHRLATAGP